MVVWLRLEKILLQTQLPKKWLTKVVSTDSNLIILPQSGEAQSISDTLCNYIQNCVQWSPSGPKICCHCWQVVVVYVMMTQLRLQNSGRCRHVVAIRRWSFAHVWLHFKMFHCLIATKNNCITLQADRAICFAISREYHIMRNHCN